MKKIALLIDGDNISPKKIDDIYKNLESIGEVKIAEVYGRSSSLIGKDWQDYGKKYSLELKQTSTNTKNSADFAMSIGGTEILHRYHQLDCFCIVSGDSDFIHLIETLKAKNKYIIGMGGENSAKKLQSHCDEFFNLSNSTNKPAQISSSQTANTNSSKNNNLQKIDPIARKEQLNKNSHLIQEITTILNGKVKNKNDFIKLSALAGILGNSPRNLKCKDYGYKTWKDLFYDLDCVTARVEGLNQVLIKLNTKPKTNSTKPKSVEPKLEQHLQQKLFEIFEKVKNETKATWWIHLDIYLRYLEKDSPNSYQGFGYKNWEEFVRKSDSFTIVEKNIAKRNSRPSYNQISYIPSYSPKQQAYHGLSEWSQFMSDMTGIQQDWDWYDD